MARSEIDLRNPIFHDDNAAREYLESVLWPQGPVCPRCGVMGDRITKMTGKSLRPGVYNCKDCRKPFSVTVGTVMERSHIPLSKWVLATRLMAASKKGFSAHELHRSMDLSYEAAWFLFHRLRGLVIRHPLRSAATTRKATSSPSKLQERLLSRSLDILLLLLLLRSPLRR